MEFLMTNITREQIEDLRGYLKDTIMDDHLCNSAYIGIVDDILDLAVRALDTTSVKPSQSIVEAVARAWASIDGHSDDFMSGKDASDISAFGGRYAGYMEDAEELLKRSGIVEMIEAAKFRGIQLPEWLLKEKEMDALDHTVSKGTRATLIYRAMIGEVK